LKRRIRSKSKRLKPDVARFNLNQEDELLQLQRELFEGTWVPGEYREFIVHEPKRRLISAAPYRDRVVHHALCNIIEPIFERGFIHDSYANRCGKGTHRAIQRCTQFARNNRYVLKADIRKYFPSIDHQILLSLLAKKIKDVDVLALSEKIISSAAETHESLIYYPGDDLLTPLLRRRGIPIGNLTSQFFANVYLNSMDHFIKRALKCCAYVRFCDDFLLFHSDKSVLVELKTRLADYLSCLRLSLHDNKTQIFPVAQGIPFLGFTVYPDYRKLNRASALRFKRRLKRLQNAYAQEEITLKDVGRRIQSWINHAAFGDTYGLRRALLGGTVFSRSK
jgi:RNA-directed DNA polymerase